jgi:TetR/AcrR family transcriptional repressor of nem operon
MVVQTRARQKIIDSALALIREKGYEATTVDALCAAAGVTKGAFFHHFKSKEDLAVAAADHWSTMTGELFRNAPYHQPEDPLARVLGYVAFRKAILQGAIPQFTCLVGMMVQETYDTHPAIRDACYRSIFGHADVLARDVELARERYAPDAPWSAKSLALHTQSVIQGAFVLAKASGDPSVAADSIDHLHRYIELLFGQQPRPGASH